MGGFVSGSAWAMARDIGEGYILVTDRMLRRLTAGERDRLAQELERKLRELRGEQPDLDDIGALRQRNQRIQRLLRATQVLRHLRSARRP